MMETMWSMGLGNGLGWLGGWIALYPIFLFYVVMSLITFGAYGLDKYKAVKGKWRITEKRLHLFEALGGWPGGFLGQRIFRHKTQKRKYQLVFGVIVGVHVGLWIAWFLW